MLPTQGFLVLDVECASVVIYDLIIIGGGVYGVMLALESAARGAHTLLVERDDFGSQTSFNNFRIIHGGLCYLQSLDVARLRESVHSVVGSSGISRFMLCFCLA
jgi:glycerol-3-phosphate dehydrogenase